MTTALSGHDIADKLRATLPDAVEESRDEWVVVSPDAIADVCRLLRDDDETDFQMLRSVDAVDFIDRFELRYGLLSIRRNQEATLKVRVWGRDDLSVPSVTLPSGKARISRNARYMTCSASNSSAIQT